MRILIVLLLLSSFMSFAQHRVIDVVHFATASAAIDTVGERKLKNLLSDHDVSKVHVLLSGHTDSVGSYAYNQQLSLQRVESVKKRLTTLGVPHGNIIIDHNGEFAPILDREGMTVNAFNRRVEILMSTNGPFVQHGFGGTYDESLIRKPFPNVQLPIERFTVNMDVENTLITKGGSVIIIPANAFENAYGRVVSGNVEVSYREFRTPAEVFASGIPMHVQDGGERQYFETGGMFDITATQRGNPLDVREGQALQMEFVSTGTPDFNFYTLDSDSGGWVMDNGRMNGINPAEMATTGLSPAVIDYLDKLTSFELIQKDHVSLEDKFYTDFPVAKFIGSKNRNEKKEVNLWNSLAKYQTRVKPRMLPEGRSINHFMVEIRRHEAENHEWLTFRPVEWEYNGPLASRDLRKLMHRKRHNDLRVKPGTTADGVNLELKGVDTILTIPLRRIIPSEVARLTPDRQEAMMTRDMARRHRAYTKSLLRQEKSRAKGTAMENSKNLREFHNARRKVWRVVRPMMTESEKQKDYTTWDAYCSGLSAEYDEFQKQRKSSEKILATGQTMVRQLTLNRLGIRNIDIIKELKYPERVVPEFALSNGELVVWHVTYLFDSNLTGVMESHRKQNKAITLDARNLKMIVVVCELGNVYRVEANDIADMNNSKVVKSRMHLTPLNSETASLDELREMIGLAQ